MLASEVIMNRFLLLPATLIFTAASCFSQIPSPAPSSDQNPSAITSQTVDPQTAVPGAENGHDSYGRPVQPVGTTQVQAPAPVPPSEQQEFAQNVKDVHFDFNRSELRADDQTTLQQDAEWLKAHPDVVFTIAGQADPRGDIVYNLFLSDERALATRDALVKLGVSTQQIVFAHGWGKLYPVCQQDDESCWSQDRRAHLAAWSPDAGPLTIGAGSVSGAE
jgi:peptidoglycan-associated lipoprotein